jgi:putative transposase
MGMPRPPRAVLPGQPLHIIQRGVNRSACFVDDADRVRYKHALSSASDRAGCAIHAYVLMTNHVHLLLTPKDAGSAGRMMQTLGRHYVRYFNDRYGRSGTLWEGRYRSTMVESDRYFLACSRYVESNAVRAGMVARPDLYRWSSYCCNAEGEPDALVTPHACYLELDGCPALRRASYRALFSSPCDPDVLDAIRRATNDGTVLGGAPHREWLEASLNRRLTRASHGGDRRSGALRHRSSRSPTP